MITKIQTAQHDTTVLYNREFKWFEIRDNIVFLAHYNIIVLRDMEYDRVNIAENRGKVFGLNFNPNIGGLDISLNKIVRRYGRRNVGSTGIVIN